MRRVHRVLIAIAASSALLVVSFMVFPLALAMGFRGTGHFEVRPGTVKVLSVEYVPAEGYGRAWKVMLTCEGRAVLLNYTSSWRPYLAVVLWAQPFGQLISVSARPIEEQAPR